MSIKKMMFMCSILTSMNSYAYLIGAFQKTSIDYKEPTHILVAGVGEHLGTQFQESAAGRALKFKENNPDSQIVFITADEEGLSMSEVLTKFGFQLIEKDKSNFDGKELVKTLERFSKIKSLDIFSHSSAQYGIHLDSKSNRFEEKTKGIEGLKDNFTSDAYVVLNGCNAGFTFAPNLSKMWDIPVAGALTSTNFQKLANNGDFYLNEPGNLPEGVANLKKNNQSFVEEKSCSKGGCLRMKPDNYSYVGFWGEYREGGLPFYKFFCRDIAEEKCLKAMKNSLTNSVLKVNLKEDSTKEEIKTAVADFLCPINSKNDLHQECFKKLEESISATDKSYNPFTRKQVECDFNGCQTQIQCDKIPLTGIYKPGTCTLKNLAKTPATTIAREYLYYMQAFGIN